MKREKLPFYAAKTAIYEWLYSTQGTPYCQYLYSRRYTRKRRMKKKERVMIPNRVGIERRFRGADNRTCYGHLEADTIVSGKQGSGALLVTTERKSRYVSISKLSSLKPQETAALLKAVTRSQKVKSITFDNGIENKDHGKIGVPTFFCAPYSSWQKGSVENVNKMIRRYIPKGSDISKVSKAYIQQVADIINKKPRKVLGYKSSYDVMLERGLLLDESVAIEG
jgi:IS30 family transposase